MSAEEKFDEEKEKDDRGRSDTVATVDEKDEEDDKPLAKSRAGTLDDYDTKDEEEDDVDKAAGAAVSRKITSSGENVFDKAKDYCQRPEFLKTFENYIREYVDYFDIELYQEGEHPHEWYQYFQTYLKLFEDTLGMYIKEQGADYHEFYQYCSERQTGTNSDIRFVRMIMASLEYDDFVKVMTSEAKNRRFTVARKNISKK